MKPWLFILLGTLTLVLAVGWTAFTLQFDPSLFRRPLYGLTHQVYGWQDTGNSYPSREVAVQLSGAEDPDPAAEARACADAFEIRSLQDGQQMTCRVFVNLESYQKFLAGNRSCVLAQAVQTPYARAREADITVNRGSLCV